jgi:hypothetical protein
MTTESTGKSAYNPYATPTAPLQQATASAEPAFFPVTTLKFAVMSFVTLGLYEVYWFYKNWKCVQRNGEDVIAPIRAIFYPIMSYALYRRVRDKGKDLGVSGGLGAGWLAVLTFIGAMLWRLPDPWWLISLLAFLPILPVQVVINDINRAVAPNADPNARFSGWNIFGIVVGGLLLILAIVGTFIDE